MTVSSTANWFRSRAAALAAGMLLQLTGLTVRAAGDVVRLALVPGRPELSAAVRNVPPWLPGLLGGIHSWMSRPPRTMVEPQSLSK